MKRRLLTAIGVAAGLLVLALPSGSRAQAMPPPSAVHSTPANLRTLMARGNKECIQPPRHFDLKALSDAQLALYGLPSHKVMNGAPAMWSHMLAHYKHRNCGADILLPRLGTSKKKNEAPGSRSVTGSGSNWAGNEAYGARGTYKQGQVTFNVPYVSGNIGSLVYFWTGVGGDKSVTTSDELVQAGGGVMICPDGYTGPQCWNALNSGTLPSSASGTWRFNFAWAEIVNGSSSGCPNSIWYCKVQLLGNIPIYPGDSLSAYVSSNAGGDGYDYFDVCNNTRSTCTNPLTNYNSFGFSDSATGECIGEEPLVTNYGGSDYYDANFGTEQLTGCYIANNSGLGQGIQSWPHNYTWILNDFGNTLVTVGSISNGTDFPLYYCTNATTTNNFCG